MESDPTTPPSGPDRETGACAEPAHAESPAAPTLDLRFRRRYLLRTLLLLLPPLAALVVAWRESGSMGPRFWLAVMFFIAWLLAWIALDLKLWRSYRCPGCGHWIGAPRIPHRSVGDPIDYRCPRCNRVWNTGLREAGD